MVVQHQPFAIFPQRRDDLSAAADCAKIGERPALGHGLVVVGL